MSQSLMMVNEQLNRFRTGEMDLDAMWASIETNLSRGRNDDVDPFDDDKAERRTSRPLLDNSL